MTFMKKKLLGIIFFTCALCSLQALTNTQKRQNFIEAGKAYLGTPYQYGGTTKSGMDCSGFIVCAYRDAGLGTLIHNSASIYNQCTKISDSEREPGDLIFFYDGEISHIAIFVGNNQILHCASSGSKTGVIISSLSENYWKNHYYASGRVIGSISSDESTSSGSKKSSSTASSKSAKKSSSSSSKKKNKSKETFSWGITLSADYDFLTTDADHFNFHMNGGSAQFDLLFTKYLLKPGIMGRYTYLYPQDAKAFDATTLFTSYSTSVGLELFIGNYVGVYGGVVFGPQAPINLYGYDGSTKQIFAPVFPGIFGLNFRTPEISLGNTNFSLVQDISFTNYQAISGEESLNFQEKLAAGLSFSTGFRVTLPF